MRFCFFSRHQLTKEQRSGLVALGYTEFVTVNPGIIKSHTDVLDLMCSHLSEGYGLVAPGRIWIGLYEILTDGDHDPTLVYNDELDEKIVNVYEAESRQAPELRIGDEPIPFVHVKWHRVI